MTDLTILFDSDARISSLQIAEETGKKHLHVMRDIRKTVEELAESLTDPDLDSRFQSITYKDSQGISRPMYSLSMRAALHMMAGYSDAVRDKVIGRCIELHAENNQLKARIEAGSLASRLFKPMTDAIKQMHGASTKPHHYTNEANMINKLVFGMTASQYRKQHNLDPRKAGTIEQLALIAKLEAANTSFIEAGLDYETRKGLLANVAATHTLKQLT